ncbi:MAG: FAD-dependent oxidoreductase [Acidimicrobiia bacterium]
MHEDRTDVVVIGAGLAGLAAAATAARAGCSVAVVDGRPPGGRASTDERHGFSFNQGPRALYRAGEGTAVLGRLGITPRGGAPRPGGAHGLTEDGRLLPLPGNPVRLLTTPLLAGRSKAQLGKLLGLLRWMRPERAASLSVNEWLAGNGLRPDAARLVSTIVRLTSYADDLDAMSADAAITQMQLGLGQGVDYLDGGWAQLVDALVGRAIEAGATLASGAPAGPLDRDGSRWAVDAGERSWSAGAVVIAAGGPERAASLLPTDVVWDGLGPPATAACLDLGLRRSPSPEIVLGVGRPLYLSTHSPPAQLGPDGHAVVHVMRYGARTTAEDQAELWDLAATAGIEQADVVTDRFLHRMVVTYGVPRPGRGLAGRPPTTVPGQAGVYVAGDWVGPTGMLADAALASGEAAGRAAVAHTVGRPVAV